MRNTDSTGEAVGMNMALDQYFNTILLLVQVPAVVAVARARRNMRGPGSRMWERLMVLSSLAMVVSFWSLSLSGILCEFDFANVEPVSRLWLVFSACSAVLVLVRMGAVREIVWARWGLRVATLLALTCGVAPLVVLAGFRVLGGYPDGTNTYFRLHMAVARVLLVENAAWAVGLLLSVLAAAVSRRQGAR